MFLLRMVTVKNFEEARAAWLPALAISADTGEKPIPNTLARRFAATMRVADAMPALRS